MSSRRVSPVLVGREAELEALLEAFGEAAAGTPRTVLIGAEAGGGKSRLVSEFAAQVRGQALVLTGGCVVLGAAGLPYAPITAVLRELVRERGVSEVTGLLPGGDAGELAALVPELGSPRSAGDPEMARGKLFGLMVVLLEQLSVRHPLVVVIEDVHWADRSTGELMAFLVRNLRRAAVLLVATFRSDELGQTGRVRRLLAELGRLDGVSRLELDRFSRGQVAAQLEAILGRPPDSAVATAVYARGGGNPLFTEVLLAPDGTLTPVLPGPTRDLLLGPVTGLPADCRRALRAAAVGGARTGHGLLAAVTGQEGEALDDALRPAVTAAVLVASEADYAFRHELFREAVLGELLPGERAGFHRAFAEALEGNPSLSLDHLPSVSQALHWRGAGEQQRALAAAWAAAEAAGAVFAYAEQLQMLELVLELWEGPPDAAGPVATDRAGVMEIAAEAARLAGEPERGLALVETAIGGLDQAGDAERAASLLRLRAALRSQLLLPGELDDLRAALRLATRPTRARAGVLAGLIGYLWVRGQNEEARPLAAELRTLAEQLGDEEFRIHAQIRLAELDGYDIIPVLAEAAEAARRIGSGRQEMFARDGITYTLEKRGEHEAAIRAGREDFAWARRLGLSRYGAVLVGNLAIPLSSAGRWDEAIEVIEEGLALDPAPFDRWFLLTCRTEIAIARGEAETAVRLLRELHTLPAADAETHRVLPLAQLDIQLRIAQGDLDGAISVAGTVPGMPAGDPHYLWPLLSAAISACAAAAAAGSPAPSRAHDALARLAESTAQPGPVERAHAAVFAAEAARAGGRPDLAAWDAAAAAWEEIGQPYPLACALLRAADTAAAHGERDAAAHRLARAADLASRLRAQPLQQQIARLSRRARIDLPADSDDTGRRAVPFGLTAREIEVLRLVARGRSNQQIAAELFISPKTASVHVSNILGKLGVTSRVEAAATAHRLHLADPS